MLHKLLTENLSVPNQRVERKTSDYHYNSHAYQEM